MASKQSEFAREAAAQPTPKTAAEVTPGPPRWWRTFPSQRWHEAIVVALVVVAAMSIRLEDLVVWTSAPEIFFHQGEPMPASLDSGFYLTLARDLVEGNYGPVDTWRAVPDYPPRPMPPPLLSSLTALVYMVTPFSLPWIAAILPVVLASLVAVPVYLLARLYGGALMAATAALLAVIAPAYTTRSGIAWFDTDIANVTWVLLIVYFAHRFAFEPGRSRYYYALAVLGCGLLFLWWWDQAPHAVVSITLAAFLPAVAFFYRPPLREGLVFAVVAALLAAAALAWQGLDLPLRLARSVANSLGYIAKAADGVFPNHGVSISEQVRPGLAQIARASAGGWFTFVVGVVGLVWIAHRHRSRCLMLLAPAALGVLTFYANRFQIFLAPMIALGAGAVVGEMWRWRTRTAWLYALIPVMLVGLSLAPATESLTSLIRPRELAPYVGGMTALREQTPEDAVVWAWWDHGYSLNFWARRATMNDGQEHDGERSVYNALPLATHDQRLAANFMRFFVVRGRSGMRSLYRAAGGIEQGFPLLLDVLAGGPQSARATLAAAALAPIDGYGNPDEWLEFFFPAEAPAIYVFLDQYTSSTTYWWHWFGTWDVGARDGVHATNLMLYGVQHDGEQLSTADGIVVDLAGGVARFPGGAYRPYSFLLQASALGQEDLVLGNLYMYGSQGVEHKRYRDQGFDLHWNPAQNLASITDPRMGRSVYNQLFVANRPERRYFQPLLTDSWIVQVWEVTGEAATREGTE